MHHVHIYIYMCVCVCVRKNACVYSYDIYYMIKMLRSIKIFFELSIIYIKIFDNFVFTFCQVFLKRVYCFFRHPQARICLSV